MMGIIHSPILQRLWNIPLNPLNHCSRLSRVEFTRLFSAALGVALGLLSTFAMPVAISAQQSAQSGLTLKKAAEGLFEIGVGTSLDVVTESEKTLNLLNRHFDFMTPENCMKPQAVGPNSGLMDFAQTDRYFDFAKKHNKKVVGHCLVWAKDDRTPPWFFKDGDQPVSRDVLMRRMERYIETMVGRYGDEVDQWDVVNEALEDGPEVWRDSGWRRAFNGSEFIVRAFEVTHQADPTATLIYNDYRSELDSKRPDLLKLLNYLQSKKAPVHAVGLQGHYELDSVRMKNSIKR